MKIYYLNNDKKPVGPYTKEEALSLKQAGIISDDTLAAVAGDSKWRPFSELVSDCSTWNKEENSPGTRESKREELNLWACFVRGMKQYAVFKGRATRKEYWSFCLFYIIFNYAVGILGDFCMQSVSIAYDKKLESFSEDTDLSEICQLLTDFIQEPGVIIGYGISVSYALLMLIPFLSVSVRRLHDTGTSAFPVIIGFISEVTMLGTLAYVLVDVFQHLHHLDTYIDTIQTPINLFIASFAFMILIGIYLLVKKLMPSDQFENKYGLQPRN